MFCYIHIPFCETKCSYCRFVSMSNYTQLQIQLYVESLCKQIQNPTFLDELKIERVHLGKPLSSVYFGWGTPSILSNLQLKQIVDACRNTYWFSGNIEITLESTPQNITLANINSWKKMWVTRISLWVQSLNNKTLAEIGRYKKQHVLNALSRLEKTNFQNVSIDFIIGLPYVKKWELAQDIELLLVRFSCIKHVSVYMLEEYSYPKSWKQNSLDESEFETEYTQVQTLLKKYKIHRYELSNFAKKWYECTHNQAYWNHSHMLAFWLDAHGYIGNYRYAMEKNFRDFYSFKLAYKDEIWEQERMIEKIMFWLRTSGIWDELSWYLDEKKVAECIQNKLLKKTKSRMILTKKGVPLLDYILKEIIL